MDFPRFPSFLTLSLVTTSKPSADSERPEARDWRRAPELVLTDSRSRPRARSGTGDCTGLAPVQRVGFSDGRHSAAPAGRPPHVGLWRQAGDRKGACPEWCPPPPPRIAVAARPARARHRYNGRRPHHPPPADAAGGGAVSAARRLLHRCCRQRRPLWGGSVAPPPPLPPPPSGGGGGRAARESRGEQDPVPPPRGRGCACTTRRGCGAAAPRRRGGGVARTTRRAGSSLDAAAQQTAEQNCLFGNRQTDADLFATLFGQRTPNRTSFCSAPLLTSRVRLLTSLVGDPGTGAVISRVAACSA